jgi:hypothetical protein
VQILSIEEWICRYAGSINVFSKISRRQFGHFRAPPECNPVTLGSEPVIPVEDVIEGDVGAFGIVFLAGFNEAARPYAELLRQPETGSADVDCPG